ncbi:putative transposase [Orientia tsutsugamushi str. TA716]|uniref:Putative transposase n=1 Tax=Orientia tsutsugamushi str. TA716 TaxID=1359175 RepID=A0A0F3NYM3_ORITS|nr:putative transposase [Orientia tsutsugamushi str. TA716]
MLKRFKIIADKYRNRRKRFGLRFNLISGIIILIYLNQFRKRFIIALRLGRAKFGCLTRVSSTHFTALYAELSLIP